MVFLNMSAVQQAIAAKNAPAAQKEFSRQTTIIKETSVKLLTGHLKLSNKVNYYFY